MAKPSIQFSLRTLLIVTLLASAVLWIAGSWYVGRANAAQLNKGKWAITRALSQCHQQTEQRMKATIRVGEYAHFAGGDLDYLIDKWINRRGVEIEEDLVDLHLHLLQSGGRLTCEVTNNGGRESETFVGDLCAQLEKTEIIVDVK